MHELVGGALEVATTGNTIAILSQSVLLIVDLDFNLLAQRIMRTTLGDFHSADMVAVGNTYVMASAAYQGNTVRTVVINEAGNYPIANAVRVHSSRDTLTPAAAGPCDRENSVRCPGVCCAAILEMR